eukprot:CCRYP_003312-RB/>CCRYP_003312-RB protein AED:0.46 eAED:0.69 QI:0/0/0/1/0/0/4/0/145
MKAFECTTNGDDTKLDNESSFLGPFSTDTASKLDILGHDGHTLGVNSTQVGIFEKTNEVSLGCFLEGKDGGGLEAEIGFEVLCDLTNETLERSLQLTFGTCESLEGPRYQGGSGGASSRHRQWGQTCGLPWLRAATRGDVRIDGF